MSASASIRPFESQDAPSIREIVRLIWTMGLDFRRERYLGRLVGGQPWCVRKSDQLLQKMHAHPGDWFVTVMDARVVGFAGLETDNATGIGEVVENGIHPDFRGLKLGQRQLTFILEELRRRKMTVAEVQTGLDEGHLPARRIYEKAGFQPLVETRLYILRLAEETNQTGGL